MTTIAAPRPGAAPRGVPAVAPAAGTARPGGNARIAALRNRMLALISAAIAFGLLAGVIAWRANVEAYTAYHALVAEDSVSVDAALRARAAALDQMGAAATFLATTGAPHDAAAARATARWAAFNTESRISWSNLSDRVQGETDVFGAADAAASDYIQQIGAMNAYYAANQAAPARTAFLAARQTLNTRLVPALSGLEAVKVEDMAVTYAGASDRITRWRWALVGAAALFALLLLAGLAAIRRMHYAWSWPLGLALLLTAALTYWAQDQLGQAASQAPVLVSRAYGMVSGQQDLATSLSQARALESIAIFDPSQAASHLADFDQYNQLVEQSLCGPHDCSAKTFLSAPDTVDLIVAQTAITEQIRLTLPRAPLIANVHFANEAAQFETLRTDYRRWLGLHAQLAGELGAGQVDAARTLSTGPLDAAFTQLIADTAAVRDTARGAFDSIWNTVSTVSLANQALAVLFPLAGLLAAYGVARRRAELFV